MNKLDENWVIQVEHNNNVLHDTIDQQYNIFKRLLEEGNKRNTLQEISKK